MTQPSHVSGTIKTITPFDLSDKTKTVESVWSMDDIKEAAEYLKNGMGFSEFALRQFSEAVLGILADHKTPASDPQPALNDKSEPQASQSSEAEAQPVVSWLAKQVNYIKIASEGFEIWKAKSHNKKWFRRIDGTPIPNDLIVCIAGAFAAHKTPIHDPQPALRDMDAPQTETSSEAGELLPFTAEVGAYSGVVGSSVHLIAPDGRFMGRIAFMCQDDALREKSQQVRMSEIIADALNRRALPTYAKLKEETK